MSIREILDLAEEEVAIRSGLLLTDHDVFQLLSGTPIEGWAARLKGDPGEVIGIRPEVFERRTRGLRAAGGNLPHARPAIVSRLGESERLQRKGADPAPIMERFLEGWEGGR